MKKISYKIYKESTNEYSNKNVIVFDKSSTLTISKQFGFKKLNCCNSNKKKCCLININDIEIYVCHIHLFKMLDDLTEILNEMDKLNGAVALINIFGLCISIKTGSLIYLRRSINNYMYDLYKEHTEDKLFQNNSLSDNQKYISNLFKSAENKEKNTKKFISSLSKGEYHQYLLKRSCLHKLQDCVNYSKRLYIPQEIALDNPVLSLNTICSVRDIKCKASGHVKSRDAVFIINTFRKDTFSFSYCSDCLYDLYVVLREPYLNDELEEFACRDFKVIHKTSDDYCFFTGNKEKRMYEVYSNNVSYVLCKNSYNMLFETVVNSTTFKELYPQEANKFKSLIDEEHFKQINKLKKELKAMSENSKRAMASLEASCQRNTTELSSYYENLLCKINRENELVLCNKENENKKLNQEIKRLNNIIDDLRLSNKSLKNNNSKIMQKLNNFDLLSQEEKIRVTAKYQEKIINCANQKSIINIRLSSKIANLKKINDLNITYIYGLKCSTLNHYPKEDLVALLNCTKKHEELYLALCPACVDILLYGLDFIERKNDNYFDDRYKLKIVKITEKDNPQCNKCKNKISKRIRITLDNVQFQMCENCVKKFKFLLYGIKEKFELINTIGGYKFFNSNILDLRAD